jgi:hypothetical protein
VVARSTRDLATLVLRLDGGMNEHLLSITNLWFACEHNKAFVIGVRQPLRTAQLINLL